MREETKEREPEVRGRDEQDATREKWDRRQEPVSPYFRLALRPGTWTRPS